MIRIKMKASAAGPSGNFQEGHVYDVPEHIAQKQADDFIRGGYAVLVFVPKPKSVPVEVEVATVKPAETTTLKLPKRK